LDLAANQNELGEFLAKAVNPTFSTYGLTIMTVLVENISLPPEVEQAVDARTKMGVIGNLNAYTQMQAADAMRDAAKNPGGTAGAGVGMGMGFAMAQQMGQAYAGQGGAAPAIPQAATFFLAINGQQVGPFDMTTLTQKAKEGGLTRETLVWKQG